MDDSEYIMIGSTFLVGVIGACAWFFKKVMRGEIGVSVNTALLALLVVILLVPFVMNFSAHFVSQILHHAEDTEDTTEEAVESYR